LRGRGAEPRRRLQLPVLHLVRGQRFRHGLGAPPVRPRLDGGPAGRLDVRVLAVPADAPEPHPDPDRTVDPADALVLGPPPRRAYGEGGSPLPSLLSAPREQRLLSRLHDPRAAGGAPRRPSAGARTGPLRAPVAPRPDPDRAGRRGGTRRA